MSGWYNKYEISFGRMTPAVKLLLIVNVGVYVVQQMLQHANWPVQRYLGLSLDGVTHFYLWQFVTYMFLHGPPFHIFLNMLLLFMMGPETERGMGRTQFYILYFVSGILAGIGCLIISAGGSPHVPCVGASGAIFGIIGAFAALFPHRRITVLLFFVIPIEMKAWMLAVLMAGIELALLLTHVIGGVANAAHLAGGVAGFVYARTVFASGSVALGGQPPSLPNPARYFKRNPGKDEAEVDRILDKIEREGMQSLTQGERDRLHRHSRGMRGG